MKSEQLQIRLTPRQKALLRRLARDAGQGVSEYVIARVLPETGGRFSAILARLRTGEDESYVLGELHDLLASMAPAELRALPGEGVDALGEIARNRVAAMVEHACGLGRVGPPAWTAGIEPLDRPQFATPMRRLRLHLLRASPVAFRRRNLFVDSAVGDRK